MRELCGWFDSSLLEQGLANHDAAMMPPLPLDADHKTISCTQGSMATAGAGYVAEKAGVNVAIVGRPHFVDFPNAPSNPAEALAALWLQQGRDALTHLRGTFALAVADTRNNSLLLALDRVGTHALAFAVHGQQIVFANRADAVAKHPSIKSGINPQGLFHYLYFYEVPAPGSIYQQVEKLLPGQYVLFENERLSRGFYWHLKYRDERRSDYPEMAARFNGLLRDCVGRAVGDDTPAAFLSGGTDSSTVAGVLAEMQKRQIRTYSIGFSAEGFDEMEYARIAAKRFGLDAREYYLKPDDILTAIPVIAQHYDEPFGNESAVPTYFCARMAHADGYKVMLAGDGGDEIFGGNSRYALQKLFEAYHAIPGFLRHGVLEPLANIPGMAALAPGRKFRGYIRQANIPLPARLESYNHIHRQPLGEMFTQDFLAQVDCHLPLTWLQDAYDRADTGSYVNRMMHLDLKFTLADNDLRKVNGMTEAAGIEVRYPLLDDALVDFSGEVPPDWKVKRFYLRWFFKTALKGFLPDEIINKSKHGFGLPFGVWAREHAPLRERIEDRLSDFKKRGWIQPAYIDHIRAEHMSGHATYFGRMLWMIVILEEWLALHNRP